VPVKWVGWVSEGGMIIDIRGKKVVDGGLDALLEDGSLSLRVEAGGQQKAGGQK
jgi:hypothetical protein